MPGVYVKIFLPKSRARARFPIKSQQAALAAPADSAHKPRPICSIQRTTPRRLSVPPEQIAGVYLVRHVAQRVSVKTVCDYNVAFPLKSVKVVDDLGTEKLAHVL